MNNNNITTPGLAILMEEKEIDSYSSQSGLPEKESLLPPLPSSSSSLPLEGSSNTNGNNILIDKEVVEEEEEEEEEVPKISNIPESYQVSTASLESMLNNVNLEKNSSAAVSTSIDDTQRDQQGVENNKLHQRQASAIKEIYQRSNSSTNLQSQNSLINDSTPRQGSVSSLSSTVSGASNRAVLKRIKSGLRKLSSPLTLTPKLKAEEPEEEEVTTPIELTDKSLPPVFKRPFLPLHKSTLSNTSNSSSASSLNPLSVHKHSHTNSSTSNRTGDISLTTPISSPIIAVNEKFGSRASSDGSDFHFPDVTKAYDDKFTLNQYDSIEEKVSYIESLKKQMENEDAAYKITERRLLSSGWASDNEIVDLRKRRDVAIKNWKENINRLEDILYRNVE